MKTLEVELPESLYLMLKRESLCREVPIDLLISKSLNEGYRVSYVILDEFAEHIIRNNAKSLSLRKFVRLKGIPISANKMVSLGKIMAFRVKSNYYPLISMQQELGSKIVFSIKDKLESTRNVG